MKYLMLLLAGLILGGLATTAAVTPSWPFSAIAAALLIASCGYAVSSIVRVFRSANARKRGD